MLYCFHNPRKRFLSTLQPAGNLGKMWRNVQQRTGAKNKTAKNAKQATRALCGLRGLRGSKESD
jgi:hypothetical protein